VGRHGVVQGLWGQDVPQRDVLSRHLDQRARRSFGKIQPDGLAGRRQGRVGYGEPQCLRHNLTGCRCSEELAAPTRRGASAAAQLGGLGKRKQPMRESRADGLDLAGVFPIIGHQRYTAWNENARQRLLRRQSHHHGGQAFVAGGDAHHAAPGWQRADQPAQDDGCVIAVSQAVHHPACALRPSVAWIADEAGEGNGLDPLELFSGSLGQQTDFPMAGVISQGNRSAIRGANSTLCAENQVFVSAELARIPTHSGVHGPAEDIPAGCLLQPIRLQRQGSGWAGGVSPNIIQRIVGVVRRGRIHRICSRVEKTPS